MRKLLFFTIFIKIFINFNEHCPEFKQHSASENIRESAKKNNYMNPRRVVVHSFRDFAVLGGRGVRDTGSMPVTLLSRHESLGVWESPPCFEALQHRCRSDSAIGRHLHDAGKLLDLVLARKKRVPSLFSSPFFFAREDGTFRPGLDLKIRCKFGLKIKNQMSHVQKHFDKL